VKLTATAPCPDALRRVEVAYSEREHDHGTTGLLRLREHDAQTYRCAKISMSDINAKGARNTVALWVTFGDI
jgi:hypothetical protein